jgi:low affinity Fe/Cu permease
MELASKPTEDEWMSRPDTEIQTQRMHDHFGRFAAAVNSGLGSTWAFLGAGLLILIWFASGPLFHFAPAWVHTVDTATNIATFLMVFLIQNTQNRDARAINLKLNELIRAMDKARNQMIDIERLSDQELDQMQANYERIKTIWSDRQAQSPSSTIEE